VLDAARELFVTRGYSGTTIEEIARQAGVSKPTVFNLGGTKQTLLRTVRDIAIAGDDAPIPVSQRPLPLQIADAPDQLTAVDLLARHLTGVASRYAQIYEVLHAAAHSGDDELRELWQVEEEQRLTGARHWVDVLTAKGPLRARLDRATAVDSLWVLMAPGNYTRLVDQRRWSERKYQEWLGTTIARTLLADQADKPQPTIVTPPERDTIRGSRPPGKS
jgi:AcrR family transcriptional regulator